MQPNIINKFNRVTNYYLYLVHHVLSVESQAQNDSRHCQIYT